MSNKELLELTLFVLGKSPMSNYFVIIINHFVYRGLSPCKVYGCLFRYEFKLTKAEKEGLYDVSIFLIFVYIEPLFSATLTSATSYDLQFIKKLYYCK